MFQVVGRATLCTEPDRPGVLQALGPWLAHNLGVVSGSWRDLMTFRIAQECPEGSSSWFWFQVVTPAKAGKSNPPP